MANLHFANKCNLFSYSFAGAKNSRNYTKNLSDFGKKKLMDWKKTQGYEALLGLLGLKKVHKKQACFICFHELLYAFHMLFIRFLYAFRTLFICFRFHMLFHSEIEVIMSKKAKRPLLLLDAPRHLHTNLRLSRCAAGRNTKCNKIDFCTDFVILL